MHTMSSKGRKYKVWLAGKMSTVDIRLFSMALFTIYRHSQRELLLGLNSKVWLTTCYIYQGMRPFNLKMTTTKNSWTSALKWLLLPSKSSPWDEIVFQQCHQCTTFLMVLSSHNHFSSFCSLKNKTQGSFITYLVQTWLQINFSYFPKSNPSSKK